MPREAEIRLKIQLDDKNVPASIDWRATDGPEGFHPSAGVLLSLWDPKARNTLSFDLWTADLTIDEMNFFVLERLFKLAETHQKATGGQEIADSIRKFCGELTEKLEERARARQG